MAQEQKAESLGTGVESAGVETLIGRLRDAGISEGRSQGEALVTEARQRAAEIVAAAKQEAEAIVVKAKEETGKLRAAGEDALRLAMRDMILAMEGDLLKEFLNRLRRMVKGALSDPTFLQRVILEVAGRVAPAATVGPAELLLPSDLVSLDDLRRKPEEVKPGTLMQFVLSMGGGMLREGIRFGVAEGGEAGIRLRLVDEDLQIDVTENAVSNLLLRHMLPRFRALLRGVVTAEAASKETIPDKKEGQGNEVPVELLSHAHLEPPAATPSLRR